MRERDYDVVTFDCYGTLIDWRTGIRDAFRRAAAAAGAEIDVDAALRAYNATEPQVEREGYRSYRDVLAETAARVARSLGWHIEPAAAAFLPDSLPSWPPFAETNDALERLARAGHTLAILSNVDDDLIAATRRHLSVDFAFVITAQQLRSYKPAPAHFLAARERVGAARWLHAAQSAYHDIVPANALGVPTAWVNRLGERALPGGVPAIEVRDLKSLAARLAG